MEYHMAIISWNIVIPFSMIHKEDINRTAKASIRARFQAHQIRDDRSRSALTIKSFNGRPGLFIPAILVMKPEFQLAIQFADNLIQIHKMKQNTE